MSFEYVKLSRPEVVYSQRNFLKAQLDVLDIIKHYLAYQELRKAEYSAKIELKTKMESAKNHLLMLDKVLPKTYTTESTEKKQIELEGESKEVSSLQQEIELIKQKLASLR